MSRDGCRTDTRSFRHWHLRPRVRNVIWGRGAPPWAAAAGVQLPNWKHQYSVRRRTAPGLLISFRCVTPRAIREHSRKGKEPARAPEGPPRKGSREGRGAGPERCVEIQQAFVRESSGWPCSCDRSPRGHPADRALQGRSPGWGRGSQRAEPCRGGTRGGGGVPEGRALQGRSPRGGPRGQGLAGEEPKGVVPEGRALQRSMGPALGIPSKCETTTQTPVKGPRGTDLSTSLTWESMVLRMHFPRNYS